MKDKTCPNCHSEFMKVIYLGFPMLLCEDETCNTIDGFFSFIPEFWFNGMFFYYEGSYLVALYHWLFD